jgi:hypothetical protein
VLEPSTGLVRGGEEPGGHVRLPQIGGVLEDTQDETRRINEKVALATVEFLRAIIAVSPISPWF